ncbi:MAG: AAA family ATPase [Pseudonocardiaceae bacterium]
MDDRLASVDYEFRRCQRQGVEALRGDRLDDALAAFGAAVCLRPELVAAHLDLGACLRRAGWLDAARRVFEKAEQIAPWHRGVAEALLKLGDEQPGRLDYRVGDTLHGADGSYQVRKVMRGGHGAVYVVDLQRGSSGHLAQATYALKTFQTRYLRRAEDRDRFANEAITWVSLDSHPNVVTALWVERIEGLPGLLLEYVPSGNLAQLISHSPLPLERALRFGIQVCTGLDHASRTLRIVHGDVKAANCLVTEGDVLKVTDFGLAQAFGSARDTRAELAVLPEEVRAIYRGALGAPNYRAPERMRPGARIDVRTDIYALGVLLYEMISGDRPRDGAVALAHITAKPPAMELPHGLMTLITDCVAPNPQDRPTSCGDVRETLERAYQVATKRPAPAAITPAPDRMGNSIRRGAALTRLGRPGEAIQWLAQVIEQDPDHRQALLHLGSALSATGRKDDALSCFNHLLDLEPQAASALVAKAGVLRDLGAVDPATSCLDRALALDPGARAAHRTKGEILAASGMHPEAVACFDKALQLDPRDERALTLRGATLTRMGRYAEALQEFNQVGRRIARGRALRGVGRFDDALAELDRLLDLDPDDEIAWGEKYELLCVLGRHDDAKQLGEQRRQSHPSPAPANRDPAQIRHDPADAPPTERARYSSAVVLAWKLAAWERSIGAVELIEPVHLLLGIAKLCDADISALDRSTRAAIERESHHVQAVFHRSGLNITGFRRALRRQAANLPHRQPARRTAHRSPRSRRVFDRAEELAARAGSMITQLDHLLRAALEELLGSRDCDPHAGLVTLAARLPAFQEPTRAGVESAAIEISRLTTFGRDLTELARRGKLGPVIGRDNDVRNLVAVLTRAHKPNALLIGEPGVGKTAVVEGLAIALAGTNPPATLGGDRRLIELSMTAVISGTKYRGEFEERLRNVIAEASTDANVVLFIDELHTILGAGSRTGGLDAANILKPALARGDIRLIGATTEADYRRYIEDDAALTRRFELIYIEEPTAAETVTMLVGLRTHLQQHHGVRIDDDAIDAAVRLSQRYQPDRRLPDKAIDLLDHACANARLSPAESSAAAGGITTIGWNDVATAAAIRLRVSTDQFPADRAGHLRGLAEALNKRVIGQPVAVAAVAEAVQVARAGLGDPTRPTCSLLFAGPAGVGKTELAKALAAFLFGADRGLIHIDLGEYGEPHAVSRLLGAPPGYAGHDDGGPLIGPIRDHPFSVVVFDAVDKAHPRVLDAVLPILDGNKLTDARGRQASFTDAVLVFTTTVDTRAGSVIGFQPVSPPVRRQTTRQRIGIDTALRQSIPPELLNRLSRVVYFDPLSRQAVREIIDRSLAELRGRLETREVELTLSAAVLAAIENQAFDEMRGARAAITAVERLVAGPIARGLVAGRFAQAQRLIVDLEDGEPVLRTPDGDAPTVT